MDALGTVQGLLMLVIGVLALGVQGFALVDALRQRTDAFPAAGKLTKPLWVTILAVATAIGVIFVLNPFSVYNLIAFVAAGVYLADVRPAVKSISGGGSNGPYGRW
jgi:Sec-independent protein secretion pathway component TatC